MRISIDSTHCKAPAQPYIILPSSRQQVRRDATVRQSGIQCRRGGQTCGHGRVISLWIPPNSRCIYSSCRWHAPLSILTGEFNTRPHTGPPNPDNLLRRRNHRDKTHIPNPTRILGRNRQNRHAPLGEIPRLETPRQVGTETRLHL